MAFDNDAMKIMTNEVRLSYANLLAPKVSQLGGEAKYSVTLLIPKTDLATKADIDMAMQAAAADGMMRCWNNARPPQLKVPIHDGDGVRNSGEAFGEECRGCWVMTGSSKNRPGIVDRFNNDIKDPTQIYSGMYARVVLRFFAYANSGSKGIGCGLQNVMKTRDGDPLGGHASASSDFAGVAEQPEPTAFMQGYQMQAYQQPTTPYSGNAYPQPTRQPMGGINPITGLPF